MPIIASAARGMTNCRFCQKSKVASRTSTKCGWSQYCRAELTDTTGRPTKASAAMDGQHAAGRIALAAPRPQHDGGGDRAEIDHRLVGGDGDQAERQHHRPVAHTVAPRQRDREGGGDQGVGVLCSPMIEERGRQVHRARPWRSSPPTACRCRGRGRAPGDRARPARRTASPKTPSPADARRARRPSPAAAVGTSVSQATCARDG